MKKHSIAILSAAIFFLSFLSHCAYAKEDRTGNWNFNETTGLINMPTARVIDYKKANLSIRMAKIGKYPPLKRLSQIQNYEPGPFSATPFDSDWWIDSDADRRLLFSPIRNVEFNLMHAHSQKIKPVVAAKWLLVSETKNMPAIAVGIHNAFAYKEDTDKGYPKDVVDANSKVAPFVVATKNFGGVDTSVDISVGYGSGRFRNRPFYGAEMFFDRKHLFSALAEYDGNVYNYGFKYRLPNSRWDFGLFMIDMDQPGFTFGYTMPF